jgi:hypothetical protein
MTKNLAPTNTPAAGLSGGAHQSLASLRGNKGVLRVEVKTTSYGSTEAPSYSRKKIPEMDQHLLYCNRILECFVDENSRFFVVSVFFARNQVIWMPIWGIPALQKWLLQARCLGIGSTFEGRDHQLNQQ